MIKVVLRVFRFQFVGGINLLSNQSNCMTYEIEDSNS